MATTDTLIILTPAMMSPPATLFATLDTIADTSTPAANTLVLDFDTTTAEWGHWFWTMPSHYGGGGLTISWKGGTDTDNTGTLILDMRSIVIADATILTGDLTMDGAHTSISDTPPATPINKMNQSTTGTITHANAGSPSAGDRMGFSAVRDVATDTNTGDLQLLEILILET